LNRLIRIYCDVTAAECYCLQVYAVNSYVASKAFSFAGLINNSTVVSFPTVNTTES